MTYKEFMKVIGKLDLAHNPYFSGFSSLHQNNKNLEDGDYIGVDWCMGGSHGNCWDDHMESVSADPEPEFQDLDTILERFCPKITFLQYKALCKKLIKRDTTYESDYYGGDTSHGVKYIMLRELYGYLRDVLGVFFEDED